MFQIREIYMKACMQSNELHAMTDDERLRLQAHLRKMYLEIEKVCDRHNLRMCAGYGNVLGALRHQGFIPWDDDLDLLMPRDDYDKFIQIYADELPGNLKVFAPNHKNGTIARFVKVVDISTTFTGPDSFDGERAGIFIDIFPLEGGRNNGLHIFIKRTITCFLMFVASSVHQYDTSQKNDDFRRLMCSSSNGAKAFKFRQVIGVVFHLISYQSWINLIDKYTRCSKPKDGFIVPVGGANMNYFKPVPMDVFFPARKMKFDDIDIYVPNKPEVHCEMEYGDWHWIPPVEERWQHFIKEIRFKV